MGMGSPLVYWDLILVILYVYVWLTYRCVSKINDLLLLYLGSKFPWDNFRRPRGKAKLVEQKLSWFPSNLIKLRTKFNYKGLKFRQSLKIFGCQST